MMLLRAHRSARVPIATSPSIKSRPSYLLTDMDESWRVSIGSMVPRRRSTEEARRRRGSRHGEPSAAALDPDDFRDVFGGPPRSILLRRFSGELSSSTAESRPGSFYDEVFRPRGFPPPASGGAGRSLAGIRNPSTTAPARAGLVRAEVGFYDDIFGSNGGRGGGDRRSRSRSKSKSKSKSSSSILSSEDVSPPMAASSLMAEDAVLSSFTSKLRPITIPSKHQISSPPSTISGERHNTRQALSINSFPSDSCFQDCKSNSQSTSDLLRQKSHIGFSCCFSPPETISLEASFRRNHKEPLSCYNSDEDSPSSVISSAFIDPLPFQAERQAKMVVMEIEEEGEASESSFSIEMGRHGFDEREGAAAIDEAIAWAKQKYWNHQESEEVETRTEEISYEGVRDAMRVEEHPLQLPKREAESRN